MVSKPQIFAEKFWPGFSLHTGFVKYLLDLSFGGFDIAANAKEADIVVSSVFGPEDPSHPRKTICFLWENIRPNYRECRYSISSDFDSYGGRNFRVPFWYAQLQWPGYIPATDAINPQLSHGYEPLVDIDMLLQPRTGSAYQERNGFCCFVANNPEKHRLLAVERLSKIGPIDVFGQVAGHPLRTSKYEALAQYKFNLCFENSIFPGYYTEKVFHAWVGGCVPLYYSDTWYSEDFNPKAIINRIDFRTLDEFAAHVGEVHRSPPQLRALWDEPLLVKRPVLDGVIGFLQKAAATIMRDPKNARGFPVA